jgi:hypothetical protein
MAAIKPQKKMGVKSSDIPRFTSCCITGFRDTSDPEGKGHMFLHLEDYRRPTDLEAIYSLSRKSHAALHARFTSPERWLSLVKEHYVHGAWFTLLSMDPADMHRQFDDVYPEGLPSAGEFWTGVSDEFGIGQSTFDRATADVSAFKLWGSDRSKSDELVVGLS